MATQVIERNVERPADLEGLFPGRYLSVTSFKRNGSALRRRCGSCRMAGACTR